MTENIIDIHREEILDLSERVQVKVIYNYQENLIREQEILRYEFKIKGQNWKFEIRINLKNKQVSTTNFYFDLATFNQDFKTIADYYASLDLSEENLNKITYSKRF